MKLSFFLLLLSCCATHACAQVVVYDRESFNPQLKKQLNAIYAKDQQYRKYMANIPKLTLDSLAAAYKIKPERVDAHLRTLQAANDAENIAELEIIIRHYDYPGKTLVGEPTNLAALSVILHSTKKQQYFPRVNQAYTKGEIPEYAVATLEDYILAERGTPQNFGTHYQPVPYFDSSKGQIMTIYYISPIDYPEHVHQRRKSKGFLISLDEYAKGIGVIYDKTLTTKSLQMKLDTVQAPKK